MNYESIYDRLIDRARGRTLVGYKERHHVRPVCMGGNNARDNLVYLTAEEHYLAHLCLVRMHPGNHRLAWAAHFMTVNAPDHKRSNNKTYGWLRRKLSESMIGHTRTLGFKHTVERNERLAEINRGKKHTDETKLKMSASQRGRKHSAETKAKMSATRTGKKHTPEHCAKISDRQIGKKRGPHSFETRAKISKTLKCKPLSLDHRKNIMIAKDAITPEQRKASGRKAWVTRCANAAAKHNNSLHGAPL